MTTIEKDKLRKKSYGEYLTPENIFEKFIFNYIKDFLYDYIWVDLYAGEGNLIFPILEKVPKENRIKFFEEKIMLFDIQDEMVKKMIKKATTLYNIPVEIANKKILRRDNLKEFPYELISKPVYHITNPPYLYIGHIKKSAKRKYFSNCIEYFSGERSKLQDLYQVALFNDFKAGIKKMIYIIPTNFIYGKSVSNEIRKIIFKHYSIERAFIIEDKIFDETGLNVGIFFFERKDKEENTVFFNAYRIFKNELIEKKIILDKNYNYCASTYFEKYIMENKKRNHIDIKFYLTKEEVEKNKGNNKILLLNANKYNKIKGEYEKEEYLVNDFLYKKIKNNILWVRTLDSGKKEGRAGVYTIHDLGVDGIITDKPYRTHPIQIFIQPELTPEKQIYLKNKFNSTLEYLREKTDSDFMTTYKYSKSDYVRKYLGLSQVKALMSTIDLENLE